jgi:hypothetical protein
MRCSAAVSCSEIWTWSPKIAKFPVKFPDSREFAWRRVRSALRRQPASPTPGGIGPDGRRKAHQWRAFAIWCPVSVLPISRHQDGIRRKSPANALNIPVFGRRRPESAFDHGLCGEDAVASWLCGATGDRLIYHVRRQYIAAIAQP